MSSMTVSPLRVIKLLGAVRDKVLFNIPLRPRWDLFLLELTLHKHSRISERLRKKAEHYWTSELEKKIRTSYQTDPKWQVTDICESAEERQKRLAEWEEMHVRCVRAAYINCIYWGYTEKVRAKLYSAIEQFDWQELLELIEETRQNYMTARRIVSVVDIDLRAIDAIVR